MFVDFKLIDVTPTLKHVSKYIDKKLHIDNLRWLMDEQIIFPRPLLWRMKGPCETIWKYKFAVDYVIKGSYPNVNESKISILIN